MRIGNVHLINNVIAAPMAGVSNRAYRILAREASCGLACTEMISDKALLFGNPRTYEILDHINEPGPLSVQIFGSDPENMAKAAVIVERTGVEIIDINMGCPTHKIVSNGEGAALMKKPEQAARIVQEVVSRVKVPVTVKMRKGWDENSVNAVEMALLIEAAGAAAVTIHGRLRSQFYSGRADWEIIKAVKSALKIPVIGNGDVSTPIEAKKMIEQTGCDAVMIGRASLGNPWIFAQTVCYLTKGKVIAPPSIKEKLEIARRHLELLVETKGERIALFEMRKHAAWYVKGLPCAAIMRQRINKTVSIKEFQQILAN